MAFAPLAVAGVTPIRFEADRERLDMLAATHVDAARFCSPARCRMIERTRTRPPGSMHQRADSGVP
jgi:hypothetical protein